MYFSYRSSSDQGDQCTGINQFAVLLLSLVYFVFPRGDREIVAYSSAENVRCRSAPLARTRCRWLFRTVVSYYCRRTVTERSPRGASVYIFPVSVTGERPRVTSPMSPNKRDPLFSLFVRVVVVGNCCAVLFTSVDVPRCRFELSVTCAAAVRTNRRQLW